MTITIRRLGVSLGLAAALLGTASAIAIAADNELLIFEWSGYEVPEFHPGYVAKNGDSPAFTFFGDEEEAFQKTALRLQGRPCASLLAERGQMARGRAAAAARHLEDRGLEGPQSRHHEDEGSGDDRRRHGVVHAVGLGQHDPHLQQREGRREGRAVAEGLRRSEIQGPRVDRRQCRRRLRAGEPGDRPQGLDRR